MRDELFKGVKHFGPGGDDAVRELAKEAGLEPGRRVAVLSSKRAATLLKKEFRLEVTPPGELLPPRGFDVVLSELGFPGTTIAEGVVAAHHLLLPGGTIAFTTYAWRSPPPQPVLDFWDRKLARDPAGTIDDIFVVLGEATFVKGEAWWLPDAAWDAYYAPLRKNVERLRKARRSGPLLDALEHEIRLYYEGGGRAALGCAAVLARREEE